MRTHGAGRSTRLPLVALVAALCTLVLLPSTAAGIGRSYAAELQPTRSDTTPAIPHAHSDGAVIDIAEAKVSASTAPVTAQAVLVFSSDFETGGVWDVSGTPGWGLTAYRKSQGNMSMYCAGNAVPAPGPYPPNMESWMVAGPFDLSGYSSASITFDIYLDCESDADVWTDVFFAGSGIDGVNFDGTMYDGYSDGWQTVTIPTGSGAGGAAGSPHAYIAFAFASDESIQFEGAYVDNVTLWAEPKPPVPVAYPDVYNVSAGVGRTVNTPGVLANDFGQSLYAAFTSSPAHGLLAPDWLGGFSYVPYNGFLGTDGFTYYAYNTSGASSAVTVTLNVVPNVAPLAATDSFTVLKDRMNTVPSPGVLGNDSDPIGDFLHAEVDTQPAHGTLSMQWTGGFDYTPDPGFVGTDTFTYHASDGQLGSPVRTVTLNVIASPPMPVYRFYNTRLGTHFYTADEAERNHVISTLSSIFRYEGVAYVLQPANNSAPLHRFYNRVAGTHFYTASPGEHDQVIATLGYIYTYEGPAYNVSGDTGGGTKPAVYRFYRPSTGTHFYTASPAERDAVLTTLSHVYSYDGPAFFLGQ